MIFNLNVKSYFTSKAILLSTIVSLAVSSTFGQQQVLKFKNYTKDNGLLHSYVLSIYQDSEGYIWVGSYGGLNRYDGRKFNGYNNKSEIKTPTNVVHCIIEPSNSNGEILWFGTNNGVMELNKRTMTFKLYPNEFTGVLSMAEDNHGNIWLGTERKGLLKLDLKTKRYSKTTLSKTNDDKWGNKINVIHKDNTGDFWIGGNNSGLIKFSPGTNTYERYLNDTLNNSLANNTINCIYEYQKKILVGTNGGGLHFFDSNNKIFDHLELSNHQLTPIYPIISGIAPDHEGDLWVSTLGGGLYELQLEYKQGNTSIISVDQYTKSTCGAYSISNNIIQTLYKDQTGNFWMGTLGGGLTNLDFYNHKFDHYQIQEEIAGNLDGRSVISVGQNKDGVIWYGTQSDGIYTYSTDLKLIDHISLTKPNNENSVVRQVYCDYKNRMWVSVDGGLFLLTADGSRKKYFDLGQQGMEYGNIHAIAVDSKDNLWIGVYEHGLYRIQLQDNPFNMNTKLDLSTAYLAAYSKGNLSSNLIWCLHVDSEDQIWVGNDKGLDIYDERRNSFLQVLDKNTSCISESRKVKSNSLWVGTYGSGLYLLDKTNYSKINYSTDNGLSSDNINGILEDANGNIWVGTEKGIASIDPSGVYNTDLSSLNNKQINSSRVHCYFLQDGLQGHEFHLNANEVFEDGRLLFGGPKGFNIFDPQNIIENTFVFPAKVNDFKIHNKSIIGDTNYTAVPEYMDSISLKFKENYFTIEFSQVCLSNPEHATYQYMLEGYDKDWIKTDAYHGRITYTGFPEGDYLLKIKAINPDGHVSDQVTKLHIHIDTPWYRSLLFRIAGIITIVVIGFYFYVTLSKRNKKKHEHQLKLQQETFKKEKLQADLDYRNRELSASAMYMVNRNEKLIEIKDLIEIGMRNADTKITKDMNKVIGLIDNVLKGKDNWENFEKNFNRIDTDFTKRLMESFPNLSNTDVKICTYMRMNLSSKEIAGLLNIAPKSLETSRLRIRKKMGLESSIYLSDFILKF